MKASRSREKWVPGLLVSWALVSFAAAYMPGLVAADHLVEELQLYLIFPNTCFTRNHIAASVSSVFWLLQALSIAVAGCCAAAPQVGARRIASDLYGLLVLSALSIPPVEGALRAWAFTPAQLCPDAVIMGLGFGLGGLILIWISRWLYPGLYKNVTVPPEESCADENEGAANSYD